MASGVKNAVVMAQTGAAANHIAVWTDNGQLQDGGKALHDFAPAPLTQPYFTLYVNGTAGNDGNDGLSEATPKRSIQAAVDTIPRNMGGLEAQIIIAPGTYAESVQITGFFVGMLRLTGNCEDPMSVQLQGITIRSNIRAKIEGMTLQKLTAYDVPLCLVQFCTIQSSQQIGIGAQASLLALFQVHFSSCSPAVLLTYGANLTAGSCTGSENTVGVAAAISDGYPVYALLDHCDWGAETEVQKGYDSIVFKDGVQI